MNQKMEKFPLFDVMEKGMGGVFHPSHQIQSSQIGKKRWIEKVLHM